MFSLASKCNRTPWLLHKFWLCSGPDTFVQNSIWLCVIINMQMTCFFICLKSPLRIHCNWNFFPNVLYCGLSNASTTFRNSLLYTMGMLWSAVVPFCWDTYQPCLVFPGHKCFLLRQSAIETRGCCINFLSVEAQTLSSSELPGWLAAWIYSSWWCYAYSTTQPS